MDIRQVEMLEQRDAEISRLATENRRLKQAALHLRCQVTRNPVGTDTWAVDRPCKCAACALYLMADPHFARMVTTP